MFYNKNNAITTMLELEHYLVQERFNFNTISIGKHHGSGYDDYVIEKYDVEDFRFSYIERGNKSTLKTFTSEAELVDYALTYLNKNRWLKAHNIGWVRNQARIEELETILSLRNITFERNDIPVYDSLGAVYRIFVFGTDIDKVQDVKGKFSE